MANKIRIAATIIFLTFTCFSNTNTSNQNGSLKILSSNSTVLQMLWQLDEPIIFENLSGNTNYSIISFQGCNYTDEIGKPELPYKEIILGIPDGAKLRFSVSNLKYQTVNNLTPVPVGNPERDESGVISLSREIDGEDYNFLPKNVIDISEQYFFKNMPVVKVKLYPVSYNYIDKSLKYIRSANISISFNGGMSQQMNTWISPKNEDLYQNIIFNFDQARNWIIPKQQTLSKVSFTTQGPWYKIEVTEDGLYKIPSSALTARGINISSLDPRTIRIYNNGGRPLNINALSQENNPTEPIENAIYVHGETDGSFDSGDYILFYGTQLGGWTYSSSTKDFIFEEHPYDTKNYYLLTFGNGQGKRMQNINAPASPSTTSDTYFWNRVRFEDDTYNLLSSGTDWYGHRFSGQNAQASFTYQISNLSTGSYPAKIRLKFKGGSGIKYKDDLNYQYSFTPYLNPAQNPTAIIPTTFFREERSLTVEKTFTSTDYLLNGQNTLKLDYTGNYESCSAHLDWVEFYYPQDFTAISNYLSFYTNTLGQIVEYNISGFTSTDVRIFDISDPLNVSFLTAGSLQGGTQNFKLDLTANEHKRLIAASLTSSTIKNINNISEFNPTKDLYDQSLSAELIVITHPSYVDYAQEIVNLRNSGEFPISGTVVNTEDIYFYFGSGVKDPVAIRNFIRHAYNNWSTQPRYVLLFGDGHYDYRNISISDTNFIPPYEINNNLELHSRESDNFYVDINLNANVVSNISPDLAIGRLPVESHLDARRVVDKLYSYDNSRSHDGWQTVITFVGDDEVTGTDDPPEWIHQQQAESLTRLSVIDKFIIKKIYLSAYNSVPGGFGRVKPEANQAIIDQINEGSLIVNYVGHGSAQVWAHENVFEMNRDKDRILNEGKLSLFIAATCTFGKYDDPRDPSFTEVLIWKENTGAIAVIAAARAVYSGENYTFNNNYYLHLFPAGGASRRIGDAFLMSTSGGSNYQKFHLFGDPSMFLADPRQQINISTISPDTLKALSKVTITGTVDKDSTVWTNLTGGASVIVNDARYDDVNTGGGIIYSVTGPRIFKGEVSVDQGLYSSEFIVPKSIRYQNKKSGRLTIYAWNESGYGDALGHIDTLLFYGTENLVDEDGPQIEIYFERHESFNNGDLVSKNPTLIAEISDENGINLTQEVGHVIEIQIDDQPAKDISSFFSYERDSYSDGKLKYNIENLEKGIHQLSLKAWDNLNNPTTTSVQFEVVEAEGIVLKNVVNYPNPFQQETDFTFQVLGSLGAEVIIKVYTISGRLIKTIDGNYIYSDGFNHIHWDGHDEDGDVIANGVYPYKIIIKKDKEHKEVIEKLVVLR